MDIKEAEQKQTQLEKELTDLVHKFQKETGLQVITMFVYSNGEVSVAAKLTRGAKL